MMWYSHLFRWMAAERVWVQDWVAVFAVKNMWVTVLLVTVVVTVVLVAVAAVHYIRYSLMSFLLCLLHLVHLLPFHGSLLLADAARAVPWKT